jgi:hypothetical protein
MRARSVGRNARGSRASPPEFRETGRPASLRGLRGRPLRRIIELNADFYLYPAILLLAAADGPATPRPCPFSSSLEHSTDPGLRVPAFFPDSLSEISTPRVGLQTGYSLVSSLEQCFIVETKKEHVTEGKRTTVFGEASEGEFYTWLTPQLNKEIFQLKNDGP